MSSVFGMVFMYLIIGQAFDLRSIGRVEADGVAG